MHPSSFWIDASTDASQTHNVEGHPSSPCQHHLHAAVPGTTVPLCGSLHHTTSGHVHLCKYKLSKVRTVRIRLDGKSSGRNSELRKKTLKTHHKILPNKLRRRQWHPVEYIPPKSWTVYVLDPTERPDLDPDLKQNLISSLSSPNQLVRNFWRYQATPYIGLSPITQWWGTTSKKN